MRIFEVMAGPATAGLQCSKIWLHNLYEPLLDLGHDVHLFRSDEVLNIHHHKGQQQMRAEFSQRLLDEFRFEHSKHPYDLFFAYLRDDMIELTVIDEIKRYGVPTCNFSCNNTHQFYLVEKLSPHFDFNLHCEKDADKKFRQIDATPIWFPMAANPKYYKILDVEKTIDVSFVGQKYAKRPNYIYYLLENDIDVQVYGPGWLLRDDKPKLREALRIGRRTLLASRALLATSIEKKAQHSSELAALDFSERLRRKYQNNLHQSLSDEDMIRKYSESHISLGFLEVFDSHNPSKMLKQHLHLREFEAPMSGALYFTGYCDELQDFYIPDAEVIVYRNEHELLEKVRYFLSHPDDANKVRTAGYRRAQKCHTYQKRFDDLFTNLGLE